MACWGGPGEGREGGPVKSEAQINNIFCYLFFF